MRQIILSLFAVLLLFSVPLPASAELVKTWVPEFTVAGPANKEELKTVLQGLLSSRLDHERVRLVESEAQADLVVAGSYTAFGKIFSIDALLKSRDGRLMRKVYEQGDGQDDLIPAMGRLAQKIDREMAKAVVATAPASETAPVIQSAASIALPAAAQAGKLQALPEATAKSESSGWTSPPLEGVFAGLAVGRKLPSGERELFLAGDRIIRYYHQGTGLKQVSETAIDKTAKILGIDTADLDGDGIPEVYVTIIDRETLVSQVYLPHEGRLEKIAEGLPYFFRGIEDDDKGRKILVQEMGVNGEFFGGVLELTKTGTKFETRNPRKLPGSGNLYNFNSFSDAAGKGYHVIMNDDGYLVVTSGDGRELWRSGEKFGGSDRYYKRETLEERTSFGDQYRWFFLAQRMIVTPQGELLVPRNDGFFVVGNLRSYKKHSFHVLRWTGSLLEEKWRSREYPTYLADFAYDPESRDLIQLEVIQGASLVGKGQSVISVKRFPEGEH